MLALTSRGDEAVAEHKAMFEAALEREAEQAAQVLEHHFKLELEHSLAAI